ncbi:protein of unknown function [Nitrospira japonica]|uniref:Uncharacterized protein n=1 Tax=Nitrospira japonica TaxID=1325564 RepID=A0A1W1I4C7_9BACT|nr:protein of unknown function [Nitrospira japonica]
MLEPHEGGPIHLKRARILAPSTYILLGAGVAVTGCPVARSGRDPLGDGWSEHQGAGCRDRTRAHTPFIALYDDSIMIPGELDRPY